MFELNPIRKSPTATTPTSLEIELQNNGTYIQWRYRGFTKWNILISVRDLVGSKGDKGQTGDRGPQGEKGDPGTPGAKGEQGIAGPRGDKGDTGRTGLQGERGDKGEQGATGKDGADGEDGREIELRKSKTHIQWRYVGEKVWQDLIALDDLRGPKGDEGEQGERGERGPQGYPGPAGPAGGGAGGDAIYNEVPSGAVDGVNTLFTTANPFLSGSTELYLNGLRQNITLHYTESGASEITINDPPFADDILTLDYIKA